jgi:hypothetical protein
VLPVALDKFKALFHRARASLLRSRRYAAKPTPTDLLDDPLVSAALRQASYESNPHALEVSWGQQGSRKREQGGWIVWNKRTGRLRVVRVAPGERDGLASIVGTRPQNTAEQEVVAWFHTHPNTITEGYSPEPSPSDLFFTRETAKAPGLVETHEGRKIIVYTGP